MDLGLGNRTTLKAWLLPASLEAGTDYDSAIETLGLGVARHLERLCNRRFARVAGDTHEVDAERTVVSLPRYPLESVDTVELRYDLTAGWTTLTGAVRNVDAASGLVWLEAVQADYPASLRLTYTGGYWYDTTEDGSGTMPAGATALPEDLQLAWLLQCEHAWQQRDKLGVSVAQKPEAMSALASLDLLPQVRDTIQHYARL